jgi:signal transduction histidine kinase/CheY-like chemotaxis protein
MRKTLYDLIIPEEMHEVVREDIKKAMEGVPIPSGELRLRRKDGSLVPVYSSHSLVRRPGHPAELYCLDLDLTEYKALEDQLFFAQKMDSIGQLVGGVAHDFNNLLQIINGYTEIAVSKLENGHSATGAIHEISKAGSRANDLVRQLLTFTRQQVIDPGHLDLNAEIESVQNMLGRLIGEHILFECELGKNLDPVFMDKGQIYQVLMNLCVNARDAMPDGGTLNIKTENVVISPHDPKPQEVSSPGRYVLLLIQDTGCGMDRETCEKIYEPFFTTKEVGKGTGLGLSTVYGIVKQNKGAILVDSEPGKGTSFKIYLPANASLTAGGRSKVSDLPQSSPGGSETLLVVEDEEMLLKLATYSLSASGYTVLTATDGEEALRVFKEHADEIDLVMMDVVMPNMGGKKAMEEILKQRPALPYLFVSGYSLDTGHNDFIKEKDLHLLSKPYHVKDLLGKIRDILDEAGSLD